MGTREGSNKFLTPSGSRRPQTPETEAWTGAAGRACITGSAARLERKHGELPGVGKKMAQGGVIGGTHLPWAEATAPITVICLPLDLTLGVSSRTYDAGSMLGIARLGIG